jgi:hypothetical protein
VSDYERNIREPVNKKKWKDTMERVSYYKDLHKGTFVPDPMALRSTYTQSPNTIFGYISPKDFLDMSADVIKKNEKVIGEIRETINDNVSIEPPYLIIDGDRIVGHEGRHRSMAAMEEGLTRIPVVLIFRDDYVNITKNKNGLRPDYQKLRDFSKLKNSEQQIRFLDNLQEDMNLPKQCKFINSSGSVIDKNDGLMTCSVMDQDNKQFKSFKVRVNDFNKIDPFRKI